VKQKKLELEKTRSKRQEKKALKEKTSKKPATAQQKKSTTKGSKKAKTSKSLLLPLTIMNSTSVYTAMNCIQILLLRTGFSAVSAKSGAMKAVHQLTVLTLFAIFVHRPPILTPQCMN